MRTILKPGKPVIGKPMTPFANDTRLNPHFLGNRARAAALCCKQHNPRPLHITLRRARCSAARLKQLAHIRPQPNLSCFGNHPDLESWLTRKEKWVLKRIPIILKT
jgi:hypothetical protein